MKTYQDFENMVYRYNKEFKKCNVNASKLCELQEHYTITEKCTKKDGRKIVEQNEKVISAEWYANVITGIGFFHDRVEKAYTMPGYLAVRLTAKNPYSDERVIREYTFQPKH